MNALLSAAIVYAVMAAYLVKRGVEVRRIAMILGMGAFVGLLLAYTLGLMYFIIVLVKPAETIAVFSIVGLLISAAQLAGPQILTKITPVGIIFVTIAVNFAPGEGPLPVSLAWLAALIPVAYGPTRVVLNLIVLYSPALIALAALRKGPPGDPWVRLLLGVWVCWVGIAATAGPGWEAMSQFSLDHPTQWLISFSAAYAAVHVILLALNLIFVVADDHNGDEHAKSLARSVVIDETSASRAVVLGVAFWIASYLFYMLPFANENKPAVALAAALMLGVILPLKQGAGRVGKSSENAGETSTDVPPERPQLTMDSIRNVGVFVPWTALLAAFTVLVWRAQALRQPAWLTRSDFTDQDFNIEMLLLVCGSLVLVMIGMTLCNLCEGLSHGRARRAVVLPALVSLFVGYRIMVTPLSPFWQPSAGDQNSAAAARGRDAGQPGPLGAPPSVRPDLVLHYTDAEDQQRLKEYLLVEKVPFTVFSVKGKEYFRVAEVHRDAVRKINLLIYPELPMNRHSGFRSVAEQDAFTAWLTKNNVKFEVVRTRGQNWVIWEEGPRNEWLTSVFEKSTKHQWLGIDYYALEIVARVAVQPDLDPDSAAAFQADEHRRPFLKWLAQQGITFELVRKDGREFIVWQTPGAKSGKGNTVLAKYVDEMFLKCLDEVRAMPEAEYAPGILKARWAMC